MTLSRVLCNTMDLPIDTLSISQFALSLLNYRIIKVCYRLKKRILRLLIFWELSGDGWSLIKLLLVVDLYWLARRIHHSALPHFLPNFFLRFYSGCLFCRGVKRDHSKFCVFAVKWGRFLWKNASMMEMILYLSDLRKYLFNAHILLELLGTFIVEVYKLYESHIVNLTMLATFFSCFVIKFISTIGSTPSTN